MKLFTRSGLLAVLAAMLSLPALADDLRIGFVNSERLLHESSVAQAAEAKLTQEFSKREKDLIDMGNGLKAAGEKFDRDSLTMPESQKIARQKQLADQDRDFQRKRREFQEDLTARKNEELQLVLERANRVVKQVAEAEKYDVILQDGIVYYNPRLDITDKILKAMNSSGK